jgi:hypothetical protein
MRVYPTNGQQERDILELGDRVAYEFLMQSSYDTVMVVRELVAGR